MEKNEPRKSVKQQLQELSEDLEPKVPDNPWEHSRTDIYGCTYCGEECLGGPWEGRLRNHLAHLDWICKRKHPIFWPLAKAVAVAGALLAAGYLWVSPAMAQQTASSQPVAASVGVHNGHPAGVHLAQVYPFAEMERSAETVEASTPRTDTGNANVSVPAIPQVRPAGLPLPAIPSRNPQQGMMPQPVSQPSQLTDQVAPASKAEDKNTYQSRIAFIGGEGIPGAEAQGK